MRPEPASRRVPAALTDLAGRKVKEAPRLSAMIDRAADPRTQQLVLYLTKKHKDAEDASRD